MGKLRKLYKDPDTIAKRMQDNYDNAPKAKNSIVYDRAEQKPQERPAPQNSKLYGK